MESPAEGVRSIRRALDILSLLTDDKAAARMSDRGFDHPLA